MQFLYACSYSREEVEAIDGEGRCVVTDHQAFIIFNIYGPAISNEENAAERYAYKLQFYKVCFYLDLAKSIGLRSGQSRHTSLTIACQHLVIRVKETLEVRGKYREYRGIERQLPSLKLFTMQALEVRINALRKRGRRVILTGDLNISPDFIDSCEPGKRLDTYRALPTTQVA